MADKLCPLLTIAGQPMRRNRQAGYEPMVCVKGSCGLWLENADEDEDGRAVGECALLAAASALNLAGKSLDRK